MPAAQGCASSIWREQEPRLASPCTSSAPELNLATPQVCGVSPCERVLWSGDHTHCTLTSHLFSHLRIPCVQVFAILLTVSLPCWQDQLSFQVSFSLSSLLKPLFCSHKSTREPYKPQTLSSDFTEKEMKARRGEIPFPKSSRPRWAGLNTDP